MKKIFAWKKYFTLKKILALKKHFTLNRVVIGVSVAAVLAAFYVLIIYPPYIKKSRNEAAQVLLQQLVLAEIAIQPVCCLGRAGL